MIFLSQLLVASVMVKAVKVPGNVSNLSPISKAWLSSSYVNIILYPQVTINTNEENRAKKVRVKAIYDGKNISFLVKWKENIQDVYSSALYGSGFAIQFPVNYSDVDKLPYIWMGSKGRAVVMQLEKSTGDIYEPNDDVNNQINESNQSIFKEELENNTSEIESKKNVDYQKNFISEGFYVVSKIKDSSAVGKMQMVYKNGYWRVTLSRPLKSTYLNLDSGAFPISFAILDGDMENRAKLKQLSAWTIVKLVGKSGGEKIVDALSDEVKGDIVNGEKIVLENCAVCHRYTDVNTAPEFMAPNLSTIGGYSTKEYLMESMVNPSAVIVPDYGKNTNKDFSWTNVDSNGNLVSTMPSYDWLDKKSRDDVVAYLKSLKAKVE